MKFVKYLIPFFLLVLVIMIAYYVYYSVFKFAKSPAQTAVISPSPSAVFVGTTGVSSISGERDITASGISQGGYFQVKGTMQSWDIANKVLNDVTYTHVVGIVGNDGIFYRIWLTDSEYQQISSSFDNKLILRRMPVLFTMTASSVSITGFPS